MKIFQAKSVHTFCLLLLVSLGLFAQSKEITIEQVSKQLSRYPCTRGTFVQEKYIPAIKRSLTSSGTFLITSRDGIIWQTEKPYPSIMTVGMSHISQGTSLETMTRIDTGSNRLFMDFSNAISSAFSGNLKEIQNSFYTNFSSKGSRWTLLLEPKEAAVNQVVKSIQLQGESDLETVTMTEQTGSTITYKFSNQSFSQEPTEYEKQLLAK